MLEKLDRFLENKSECKAYFQLCLIFACPVVLLILLANYLYSGVFAELFGFSGCCAWIIINTMFMEDIVERQRPFMNYKEAVSLYNNNIKLLQKYEVCK